MIRNTATTRALLICLLFVGILSYLGAHVVGLHMQKNPSEEFSSEDRYLDRQNLPANRGMILDRNSDPLALNVQVNSLMADKYHLTDAKVVSYGLAYRTARLAPDWDQLTAKRQSSRIHAARNDLLEKHSEEELIEMHLDYAISVIASPIGMSREDLKNKVKNSPQKQIIVKKELDKATADQLEKILREQRIQGFAFDRGQRRIYLSPDTLVHVTGYANHENQGQSGLEKKLDPFLSGQDGFRIRKRNSRGLLLPDHKGETNPPIDGLSVRTTIDMNLQSILEEELTAGLAEFDSNTGTAILMDPNTGDVLAMASRPSFNLNNREGVQKASFHFALQAGYEPGSTFKIVGVSAALDLGVVNYESIINCHGGSYHDGSVHVPDHHGYGGLPVWGVIQKSSNIGTYILSKRVGRQKFVEYAKAFGFGQKTGIELPYENKAFLGTGANPTDFSRMSYGYAVDVTPLQIANAYCAIANGGKRMRPRIVDAVLTADGSVAQAYDPEVMATVMKPETAEKMRKALATVCEQGGTALSARVPGYKVGGKTGTALKHRPGGGYYHNRYTVSFAGMLPADKPKFVCLVVVDDPQTNKVKRYGGTIAAPIFGKIATRVAAAMNIPQTEPIKEDPSAEKAKDSKSDNQKSSTKPRKSNRR